MIEREEKLYKIDGKARFDYEQKENENRKEIRKILEEEFKKNNMKVLEVTRDVNDYEELKYYSVRYEFELDNYTQQDVILWKNDESLEDLIKRVNDHIEYIKELRVQYPEYCKQNDYIQSNRDYKKELILTHMGYQQRYYLDIKLCDYLKLPNTTDCGFGGGDYEIKRTPKRVKEYNENIDKTIDMLLDCISDLKKMKYVENRR